ncbi:lipopolysaccharide kinase [Mycolicibacterium duvalii]|uniref:LPS kinase n=1 Tax=Mycolicibacterium duvalii TaxID=39688 RepID=A0A7I7K099_9MYCO|nr:DUF4032 domain-containing protein [Mycolicibacterium duvalii]MCV7368688.1 DUF4032 domain-containing protein [Mycolicibacterium duvalii]PEG35614.1 lipopolysaccharide kinase [Mycolicibacterium duvalii]BBX16939.1 LPS kinase [Mycolicibacterium duvalii]
MAAPELRLRAPHPGLVALPWERPLDEWAEPRVAVRDLPVGPSRHLVKFVESDDALWALKELPARVAAREYQVLSRLEAMGLNAVRPAGVVIQSDFDTAILLTRYLDSSWQYRRLFMRLNPDTPKHRARLFDAMATLLVELHRHGVFWGDCSLANTLFVRDGQVLQAFLVDAETSEVHPSLSDGQRTQDIDITVENVAAGLLDVAASLDRHELQPEFLQEAIGLRERYEQLWELLHANPTFGFADRYRVEGTIRKLNDLGFAVDEVSLQPVVSGADELRLHVAVGDRRFHATELRRLAGMEVGEGQARILLGDLHAYRGQLSREAGHDVDLRTAAQLWFIEVATPMMHRAHEAVGRTGSPIQAYCDLLEVRWLLSEQEGRDVGTEKALRALARQAVPEESAAQLLVVEIPTEPFSVLDDRD